MTQEAMGATPEVAGPDAATAQLDESVRRVHRARNARDDYKAMLEARRKSFDDANREVVAEFEKRCAEADAAEQALRTLAVAHFQITGDKKPVPGVEVKERERLTYSEAEAFAWGKQTGMAIVPEKLDVKAFEKIAKATTLPFVVTIVEPQAQIATDLNKVLGGVL